MDEDRRWSTVSDRGRWVEDHEIGKRAMIKAGRSVIGIVETTIPDRSGGAGADREQAW
jgi:hypothetical protein